MKNRLSMMIRNDTPVVTVPSAYSTGVVAVVVIPKISSGRVLYTPAASRVRANSSNDRVNPNSPTPTRLGPMIGSTTNRNTCHGRAPRSRAASS